MARKDYKKTKFPGIYVKEDSKTKVKTYLARIKVNGFETEHVVGYSNDKFKTNPTIAYEKRNELVNKIKSGHSIKHIDNPTLHEYYIKYLELKRNTLSIKRYKDSLSFYNKYFSSQLQNKKLSTLTKDDMQKIINQMIKNGKKPSYIQTLKSNFSPVIKKALEDGILNRNIMLGLNFPTYDANRYFTLAEDKTKALYQEILNIPDNQYRLMFLFLLRGRRVNEVLSLCWEDIDLNNNLYIIKQENSKIKKTLSFPLDMELMNNLNILKKENGLIFKSPKTGKKFYSFPKRLWSRIKESVGIEDMKLHDFRHLLGYTLVNNNVPLENISKALGHSRITTTQMYSNQREKMAEEAIINYLKIIK